MKVCSVCGEKKEISEFHKHRAHKDGLASACKICTNNRNSAFKKLNKDKIENKQKKYRQENKIRKKLYNYLNKESIRNKQKEYREVNKDIIKEQRKQYRLKNKEKINGYRRQKMIGDPLYKLSTTIRNLINDSIRKNFITKSKRTTEILGCSFDQFKIYIENKFDNNMNWDNHGIYWHLDHITPISWAKSEEEVYELNKYTNFQPLKAIDNLSKNNRFNW